MGFIKYASDRQRRARLDTLITSALFRFLDWLALDEDTTVDVALLGSECKFWQVCGAMEIKSCDEIHLFKLSWRGWVFSRCVSSSIVNTASL